MTDNTDGPRPTNSPSKAQGRPSARPQSKAHAYNAPGLCPLQFLQAVYRDPSVPMSLRMQAAEAAAPYVAAPQGIRWEDRDPMDRVTIVVGGLPEGTSVTVSSGTEPRTLGDDQTDQTEKHSQKTEQSFQHPTHH
jgi:hypothetical protein